MKFPAGARLLEKPLVRPLAGAGIEISTRSCPARRMMFAPSRGRELK